MFKLIFIIIPLIVLVAWTGRRAYTYFAGTREKDNALAELEQLQSSEEVLDINEEADVIRDRIATRTQNDTQTKEQEK